jgi:hypothetical protein
LNTVWPSLAPDVDVLNSVTATCNPFSIFFSIIFFFFLRDFFLLREFYFSVKKKFFY